MPEIRVDIAVPARAMFGFDAVERRIALYVCGRPLPLSLRGDRARLVALVELGVARLGSVRIAEVAGAYRWLSEQARISGCPIARERVVAVWPDRRRGRRARVLAQSPCWPRPGRVVR